MKYPKFLFFFTLFNSFPTNIDDITPPIGFIANTNPINVSSMLSYFLEYNGKNATINDTLTPVIRSPKHKKWNAAREGINLKEYSNKIINVSLWWLNIILKKLQKKY